MVQIRDELGPEFERIIELRVDSSFAGTDKMTAEATRLMREADAARHMNEPYLEPEARHKVLGAIMRDYWENDPEYQRSLSSSRSFATQFRTRMTELLTDGQRRRLQELVDNPPPHVRMHLQRIGVLPGENAVTSEESESERAGCWQRYMASRSRLLATGRSSSRKVLEREKFKREFSETDGLIREMS